MVWVWTLGFDHSDKDFTHLISEGRSSVDVKSLKILTLRLISLCHRPSLIPPRRITYEESRMVYDVGYVTFVRHPCT